MLEPMGDFLNGLKILSSHCRQQDACYASVFCPLYDALDITQKFWGIEVAMGIKPYQCLFPKWLEYAASQAQNTIAAFGSNRIVRHDQKSGALLFSNIKH